MRGCGLAPPVLGIVLGLAGAWAMRTVVASQLHDTLRAE
jgi:hypothetical protein